MTMKTTAAVYKRVKISSCKKKKRIRTEEEMEYFPQASQSSW